MRSNNWNLIKHPLIENSLTHLRDIQTTQTTFVNELDKIASLLVFEVCKNLKTKNKKIKTPFEEIISPVIKQEVVLIPILRAGWSMLNSFQKIIGNAKIGHIGLKRMETDKNTIKKYYINLPKIKNEDYIIVLDVMIATGNSAIAAIQEIRKQNSKCHIFFVSVIISKYAQEEINKKIDNVTFFTTTIDENLNSKNYIVPGLGDAGDRYFGC